MSEFTAHNYAPKRKRLVEDCFVITLADFGKGLLTGRSGAFTLSRPRRPIELECRFSNLERHQEVRLTFGCGSRFISQKIRVITERITFGVRPYLQCACGHRANKLYMRTNMPYRFGCRRCLNLRYEITRINRKTRFGELAYRFNRALKIQDTLHAAGKLHYNGVIKKKMGSIARMYDKWLDDEPARAAIQAQVEKLTKQGQSF